MLVIASGEQAAECSAAFSRALKSLNVMSWEEACELNPSLGGAAPQVAAE